MGFPTSLISPQSSAAPKLITHLLLRSLDMQRSAFNITLFALFAIFSVALASPLPEKAIQEARELVVELNVREAPTELELLSREVDIESESGADLPILAREHQSFDEYVKETSNGNTARDTSDIEPRNCENFKMCQ